MPGPDILFVMAQSVVGGRRAGIWVALGLCSGLFVHTALAAIGLSLIVASSPTLYAIIRYAGVAYLIYMGVQSLRHRHDPPSADPQTVTGHKWGALYRTGITMNLLNPKVILFFLALFPQFLDMHSPSTRSDILLLGATFAAVAILIFTLVALIADWISTRIGARRIPQLTLAWIQSIVYWAIALLFLF